MKWVIFAAVMAVAGFHFWAARRAARLRDWEWNRHFTVLGHIVLVMAVVIGSYK
jgi:hypothetical protein